MKKGLIYEVNDDVVADRVIDGEAVILNLDNGNYYSLNDIGTRIWGDIKKKKSVDAIVRGLAGAYDVPEKTVESDMNALVKELKKEELITERV